MHCHPSLANPDSATRYLLDNVPCPPPFLDPVKSQQFIESQNLSECDIKFINRKCNKDEIVTYATQHYTDIYTTASNITSTTTDPITEPVLVVENAGFKWWIMIVTAVFIVLVLALCLWLFVMKRQKIMEYFDFLSEKSKEKKKDKDTEYGSSVKGDKTTQCVKSSFEWDEQIKAKYIDDEGDRISLKIDIEITVHEQCVNRDNENYENSPFL